MEPSTFSRQPPPLRPKGHPLPVATRRMNGKRENRIHSAVSAHDSITFIIDHLVQRIPKTCPRCQSRYETLRDLYFLAYKSEHRSPAADHKSRATTADNSHRPKSTRGSQNQKCVLIRRRGPRSSPTRKSFRPRRRRCCGRGVARISIWWRWPPAQLSHFVKARQHCPSVLLAQSGYGTVQQWRDFWPGLSSRCT